MRYQRFKEQDIIDKTQDMIRLLVSRQSDSFMKQLDGSFVQIGGLRSLTYTEWPQGLQARGRSARTRKLARQYPRKNTPLFPMNAVCG